MFTHVHAGSLYALSEQLASLRDLTGPPNSRKGLFETAGRLLDVPVAASASPTSAALETASIAGKWVMTSVSGDKFYYSWKAQDKVHNTFGGMQTDEDFARDRFGVTGTLSAAPAAAGCFGFEHAVYASTPEEKEVYAIYSKYAPDKLKDVSVTLKKYAGRLPELVQRLRKKYVYPSAPAASQPAFGASLIGKGFADGSFEIEWKCFTGPAASGKFQVWCKGTLNGDMDRISDGQYFDEKVRAEPTSRTPPAHCPAVSPPQTLWHPHETTSRFYAPPPHTINSINAFNTLI